MNKINAIKETQSKTCYLDWSKIGNIITIAAVMNDKVFIESFKGSIEPVIINDFLKRAFDVTGIPTEIYTDFDRLYSSKQFIDFLESHNTMCVQSSKFRPSKIKTKVEKILNDFVKSKKKLAPDWKIYHFILLCQIHHLRDYSRYPGCDYGPNLADRGDLILNTGSKKRGAHKFYYYFSEIQKILIKLKKDLLWNPDESELIQRIFFSFSESMHIASGLYDIQRGDKVLYFHENKIRAGVFLKYSSSGNIEIQYNIDGETHRHTVPQYAVKKVEK
jgi:hypothetical protein